MLCLASLEPLELFELRAMCRVMRIFGQHEGMLQNFDLSQNLRLGASCRLAARDSRVRKLTQFTRNASIGF